MQAINYADKRCRKLKLGKVEFSPEYKQHEAKIRFLKLLVEKKQGRRIKTHTLSRAATKARETIPIRTLLQTPLGEMQQNLREHLKLYRKFKEHNAGITRANWLEDLAIARAQDAAKKHTSKRRKRTTLHQKGPTINTATAIKALKLTESMRKMYRRINHVVGKNRFNGITMVMAKNGRGEWEQVTDHATINRALIDEYRRKYHQTENTPPMTPPMVNQIGYLGIGSPAQQVLHGTFRPHHSMDRYASLLLKNLTYINQYDPLPAGITTRQYQQGLKKAKEKTSSGGKVIHFGHCKSIAEDYDLASMDAAFLSLAMRSGYAYHAWTKGINCTLQKKANSLRVDKLRTIVLFEADFNFVNKMVSKKVADRTDKYATSLATEQFGSRKDHRAIEHVLNKRLCMDLLRQKRTPGAIAPTDLKSCYDRVCHSVASLCLQQQGVPESEVVCMFTPLQYLEHTIRCAYGDSDETYGSEKWAVPMQGLYQGNGAGPIIWAVVSSPILQILRKEGFGTFFKSSISGKTIRLVGYAFVDDTDLIQTAKPHENIHQVLVNLQKAIDMWEGLIQATGGALAVDKCRWWAIDFKWSQGHGRDQYGTHGTQHPSSTRNSETPGSSRCV